MASASDNYTVDACGGNDRWKQTLFLGATSPQGYFVGINTWTSDQVGTALLHVLDVTSDPTQGLLAFAIWHQDIFQKPSLTFTESFVASFI